MKLARQIEVKLNLASNICLIVDIWTNKTMSDFKALAASCSNSSFEKEIIVNLNL